eukprot:5823497-Alexandrium_andersonii.AAC.1
MRGRGRRAPVPLELSGPLTRFREHHSKVTRGTWRRLGTGLGGTFRPAGFAGQAGRGIRAGRPALGSFMHQAAPAA